LRAVQKLASEAALTKGGRVIKAEFLPFCSVFGVTINGEYSNGAKPELLSFTCCLLTHFSEFLPSAVLGDFRFNFRWVNMPSRYRSSAWSYCSRAP
jgi:hypothetical protein